MALPRLRPATYRKVTLVALVLLVFIVVTGALVRLTNSGLGCPDWPTCYEKQFHAEFERHAMIEFINRTITGLVSVGVMLAVLGSLVRSPRRKDLTWLSVGLVGGVIAQILIGAAVVLLHLKPIAVIAHFLASMVLIWNAVVLHHRAGEPDGRYVSSVPPALRQWSGLLVGAAALVLCTGTVVTGAGPHGGDESVKRLDFFVPDVARIHGISVMIFLALTLVFLWQLRKQRIGGPVFRASQVLLVTLVAQGALGYTQYFTGVPVVLVAIHVFGACAVFIAVLRVRLACRTVVPDTVAPVEVEEPTPALA